MLSWTLTPATGKLSGTLIVELSGWVTVPTGVGIVRPLVICALYVFVDGGCTVNDQSMSMPARAVEVLSSVIDSVQVPMAFLPLNVLRGCSGWNWPVNGALAVWIDVDAASARIVPLKFAPLAEPAFLISSIVVPSGDVRNTSRSGSLG